MFSVSRPIEVVVLNDWVTMTKVTPLRSNTSTSLAKSISDAAEPVDLVDHDHVDPAGLDVGEQALQRRALQRAAGEAAVVVAVAAPAPSPRPAGWRRRPRRPRAGRRGELNSCSSPSSVDLRV